MDNNRWASIPSMNFDRETYDQWVRRAMEHDYFRLFEADPPSDGLDMAFFDGYKHVLKEIGDGGISDSYIAGLKSAIECYEVLMGDGG